MSKNILDKDLNYFGELSDRNLENEFQQLYYKKSVRFIELIVLTLGILNTLFLLPDIFLIHSVNIIYIISVRIIFLLMALLLLFKLKHIKDFKFLSHLITAYEVICISFFIFIFYAYKTPNYLIQSYGVMVIILGIFLVPNRWTNMVFISAFLIILFNLLSFHYIKNIKTIEFAAVVVYMIIVLILSSIISLRDNRYERIQFLNSKELLKLSTTDPLTGLYNRFKLNEEFKHNIEYSKRYNTPLCLVIIDLDDFKQINDIYGHIVGDNVIVKFTDIVKANIREIDILARWGGEEFIILLPSTDIENALEIAERLRMAIEKYRFPAVQRITCSFGVAQLTPDDNIESLIHKADLLLYEAKSNGKNTVRG